MEKSIAWLGLDGHSKFSLLAWMDDQGNRRGHWRFRTTDSELVKHIRGVPAQIKHLGLEECGLGRWLAQVARPHVTDVIVCDPRENYRISRHHHKCDEEDAYSLAHLLRLGALKEVWQPTDQRRVVFKCAAQAYLDAVKRETALKLQIKAHYRQWGVIATGSGVFGQCRGQCLERLPHASLRAQMELLYQMLDKALEVQANSRRLMVQLGQSLPEINRLRTVPGVGRIGAHLFVAFIQEPGRFCTAKQLNRYCGLGIRDRSSDGKPLGYQRLDKSGHGVLKAISYRAWLAAAKRRSGPVYEFYRRSVSQTGDEVHGRLNTQRKILQTLLAIWRGGGEFDPERFLGNEPQQPTAKTSCS